MLHACSDREAWLILMQARTVSHWMRGSRHNLAPRHKLECGVRNPIVRVRVKHDPLLSFGACPQGMAMLTSLVVGPAARQRGQIMLFDFTIRRHLLSNWPTFGH